MAYVHQRYAQRSPSPRIASSPRTPHHRYVQRSPSPEIACSPRTPPRIAQPSSADGIEQSPQVLRLVAKPHAKIVPGKLASKDILACAAAASPTRAWNDPPAPSTLPRETSRPTSVRDTADAEQDQSQNDKVRSRSRSIACQQSFPEMDADDSLWELVWQPIENMPALSASQPEETIDNKQRGRPTSARGVTPAPTTPQVNTEGANPPDNSSHTSGPKALQILPPTPCGRMASPAPPTPCGRMASPTPSRRRLKSKSPSRSPSPERGRSRLRCKSPSASPSPSRSPRGSPAPSTPAKRRLRGKQPDPDEPQGTSRSPSPVASRSPSPSPNANRKSKRQRLRGHYDVLGLPRKVESSEIRAAYRHMALATHPDHGGDPDDFRRVAAAFEELGDESRRTAYDRNLGLFGSRDGSSSMKPTDSVGIAVAAYKRMALATHPEKSGDPHDSRRGAKSKRAPYDRNLELFGSRDSTRPEDVARWWYGAARVTLFKLMDLPQTDWAPQIASMQNAELQALLHLLHGSMILTPAQSGNDNQADRGYQGSQRSGSGYKLVMSWAHLSSSSVHADSVAQAIDWQIAFAWLRTTVQARLEECLGQSEDTSIEEERSEDHQVPKLPFSESSKNLAVECKSLPQAAKETAAKDKDKQKDKIVKEKNTKEKEPAAKDKNKQKEKAAKERGLKRKRDKETAPKDKNKQKEKAAKEKEQLKRKKEKEKEAKAKAKAAAKKKADVEKLKAKKLVGSTKKKAVMKKLRAKTVKETNKKNGKAKAKAKAVNVKGSKKAKATRAKK